MIIMIKTGLMCAVLALTACGNDTTINPTYDVTGNWRSNIAGNDTCLGSVSYIEHYSAIQTGISVVFTYANGLVGTGDYTSPVQLIVTGSGSNWSDQATITMTGSNNATLSNGRYIYTQPSGTTCTLTYSGSAVRI